MGWIAGEPLGGRHLRQTQLTALRERVMAVHAIRPVHSVGVLPAALGTASAILGRIRQDGVALLARQSHGRDALGQEELWTLWQDWLGSPDPATLAAPAPVVFSRGDPNLMNCLWDNGHLRLVDFEHSGWSDRATDLADLVEHVQSRATPDDDWLAFVDGFTLGGAERRRFEAAQRMFALFWALLLWRMEQAGQAGTRSFADQLPRAHMLLQR
jgi:aminoglycoside phosphotransferase (APT) family kinase protein